MSIHKVTHKEIVVSNRFTSIMVYFGSIANNKNIYGELVISLKQIRSYSNTWDEKELVYWMDK